MKTPIIEKITAANGSVICHAKIEGTLRVIFLGETLARVTWQPTDGFLEPVTWAIYPCGTNSKQNASSGVARSQVDSIITAERPFLATNFPINEKGDTMLTTKAVSVSVTSNPLRLLWSDTSSGETILADRETSAYFFEKRTGGIRHYLFRDKKDYYYGLGDKTGTPINTV